MKRWWLVLTSVMVVLGAPGVAFAKKQVMLITQRGCEEVCKGFRSHLETQGDVEFLIRDTAGDMGKIAGFVAEAKRKKPDLIATWGTGITLAVVGRHDAVDPAAHITDIPVVYMYVGNPVESKIALSVQQSGRPHVAGANTSVPVDAQINLLTSYRPVKRVGMIFNPNEAAAVAQAGSAKKAMEAKGLEVLQAEFAVASDGQPRVDTIESTLDLMARQKPDFLYYVGSAFTLAHIGKITESAIARGMPMFSPLEPAYRKGEMLLGLISPLSGIGQVAAYQAGKILFEGKQPGTLPSPTLSRHSVLINMRAARALKMYPPMKMLQYAEITD